MFLKFLCSCHYSGGRFGHRRGGGGDGSRTSDTGDLCQTRQGNENVRRRLTYLPLRVNQAGVIPIIFALSLLLFPQMIGNFLANSSSSILLSISKVLVSFSQTSALYAVLYFILVFLFHLLLHGSDFRSWSVGTNLQKNGAFIPGIRPGISTSQYISKVLSRITLLGAVFLGFIAVLPLVVQSLTGITAISARRYGSPHRSLRRARPHQESRRPNINAEY